MTGITKDELMDMSRKCGIEFCEEESAHSVFVSLAQLHNEILEHAAVECDKRADVLTEHENKIQSESGFPPAWEWTRSARTTSQQCAKSIRALKINIGD